MKRYLTHGYLMLVLLWTSLAAQAEDIEVYRGQSVGIRPNVMFVMDVSGSMSYWEYEKPQYDPDIEYNDPDYKEFNADYYYFTNNYSGGELSNSQKADLKRRPALPGSIVCSGAITSLKDDGFVVGMFKRWSPSKKYWEPLYSNDGTPYGSTDKSAIIECKADEGEHPTGKYVNVNNSSSQQYVSSIPKRYNRYWKRNFRYIYSGNYLNYQLYLASTEDERQKSRMQIAREAAKTVVNTTTGVRLGLARFNSYNSDGGFIDIAADDVEKIRSEFTSKIDTYLPWGGTPLSESYYETVLYLKGENAKYGGSGYSRLHKQGQPLHRDSKGFIDYDWNRYTTYWEYTPSVSDSYQSGSRYKSPIDSACQSTSSVILFTDGVPSSDEGVNYSIQRLVKDINFPSGSGLDKNCSGNGGCADELAYYLANYDQRPDLPGKQVIRTFVIGGFFDDSGSSDPIDYMKSIATNGGGEFFAANNYQQIVDALQKTLQATSDTPVTFVAPAVAANAYNSLEHLDELYYAMFVPEATNDWHGNLKSYRLRSDGVVVDSKSEPAVNSDGSFKAESRSFWTDESILDGDDVVVGGAASKLQSNLNILTHLGGQDKALDTEFSVGTISKSLLGLSSSATTQDQQLLIDWINRKDTAQQDGVRREMEDPLHSRPLIVTYKTAKAVEEGGQQKGVVFVGTNSGYLHAFNANKTEFREYFSYVPKELIKNAKDYVLDINKEDKTYGVDGPMNYWHADKNRDGIVDSDEKVYLFFGLRRGGRHYYALDISDPEKPKYMWQIDGGVGDFNKLGQTWAPMSLAKVPWKGGSKVVLLFGGGYDPAEDERTSRAPHSMGNAVYMIDPVTGQLLWSASNSGGDVNNSEMTSAITSKVSTIDFDGDGITDYFFASDLGGRVWRFDINKESKAATDFIAGSGVIFDANGSSAGHYQRFYYAPSISYFADRDKSGRVIDKYLTLSIGSGYRAHPLAVGTQDSFYIIKDSNVETPPQSYFTHTPAHYADIPVGAPLQKSVATPGWKYDLSPDEKVLSKSLTAKGNIYFTTFSPTKGASNPGTCTADIGTGASYIIDFKADDNPGLDPTSPYLLKTAGTTPGIPPQPIEIIPPQDKKPDPDFCEENPGHEDCKCPEGSTAPECVQCEQSGSVILSGTSTIGGTDNSCDLITKEYWYEL